jgi:hypothetical protein
MNENKVVQKKLLVVGQPVLDHGIHVDVVHQGLRLMNVMEIDAGRIIFKRGSYISTEYPSYQRLVFGPFLDYEEDVEQLGKKKAIGREFDKGAKVSIPPEKVQILGWEEDIESLGVDNVGRLGYVSRAPGGGVTNCCYIISQIFQKLPLDLCGIYSTETDGIIEESLETIVGAPNILRVNRDMPINIVLEGIRKDRIILKSPQPKYEEIPEHLDLDAGFLLVNTIYNVHMACAALSKAMEAPSSVVACTISLLSEDPIPPKLRDSLKPYGISDKIDSVYSLFKNVILPESPNLTYIFNEAEFHHLLRHRYPGDERIYVLNGEGRILFDQLILGMRRFRQLQAPHKTHLVVTVGEFGAFWLDMEDDLHYCAVLTSEQTGKVETQRNAIGDLFAGVLAALLYGYNGTYVDEIFCPSSGEIVEESLVPPILTAASAAADAGVFDGFYSVREASVNSNIHPKTRHRHYRFFGNLNEIRTFRDLISLEEVLKNHLGDLTKGEIRASAVVNQLVPRSLFG